MNERAELHKVLKDLLQKFDLICRSHNLTYCVCGGTLLGAIRHKGFIPWDDDIDVVMPREDYNKLIELPLETFQAPYFFQSPVTDNGFQKGFCRLRNSNTTAISIIDAAFQCNQGVFIDIFPLDAIPDDDKNNKRLMRKLSLWVKLLHFSGRYNGGVGTLGLDKIVYRISYYLLCPLFKCRLLTTKQIFECFNKIASRYNDIPTKRVGIICCFFAQERFMFERSDYEQGYEDIPFEDIIVRVPIAYDSILKKMYGDYMVPKKEPSCHGDIIFEGSIPYREYIEEHSNELRRLWLEDRMLKNR